MRYEAIPCAAITALSGSREIDPDHVRLIADRLEAGSDPGPIDVRETAPGCFVQISGQHRLAAHLMAGRTTIAARVFEPGDLAGDDSALMLMVEENLIRRELTVLDRAVALAQWREVHERAHPPKRGRPKKSVKSGTDLSDPDADAFHATFSDAAQRALGLSRRDFYRLLAIARIDAVVRMTISLHPVADNQSELLLLAEQAASVQARIAEMLTGPEPEATTVQGALDIIDGTPERPRVAAVDRLQERFSALKEAERDRFFAMNEDAILEWVARRNGGER